MNFEEAICLLRLDHEFTPEQLQAAYFHQAKLSHPDSGGSEEKFLHLKKTYDFLKNYHFSLRTPENKSGTYDSNKSIQLSVDITLDQAEAGGSVEVFSQYLGVCTFCSGTKKISVPEKTCVVCSGTGSIQSTRGIIRVRAQCPSCHGEGFVTQTDCKHCNGTGKNSWGGSLNIEIPIGVSNGQTISSENLNLKKGSNNIESVVFNIKEHNKFSRKKDNLYTEVEISFFEACCGCDMNLSLLNDKEVKLSIPAGTQSGEKITFQNFGMPHLELPISATKATRYGDLIIIVRVKVPQNLTDKQKHWLKIWHEL